MRSDLVKAALVLGVSLVLGAAVLVLGMRWAIGSALAAHLPALNATIAETGEGVGVSVQEAAGDVSTTVARSMEDLDGSVEEVSTTVGTAASAVAAAMDYSAVQVSETMSTEISQLDQTVETRGTALTATAQQIFEKPVLIDSPGALRVQGPPDGGSSLPVDVSLVE